MPFSRVDVVGIHRKSGEHVVLLEREEAELRVIEPVERRRDHGEDEESKETVDVLKPREESRQGKDESVERGRVRELLQRSEVRAGPRQGRQREDRHENGGEDEEKDEALVENDLALRDPGQHPAAHPEKKNGRDPENEKDVREIETLLHAHQLLEEIDVAPGQDQNVHRDLGSDHPHHKGGGQEILVGRPDDIAETGEDRNDDVEGDKKAHHDDDNACYASGIHLGIRGSGPAAGAEAHDVTHHPGKGTLVKIWEESSISGVTAGSGDRTVPTIGAHLCSKSAHRPRHPRAGEAFCVATWSRIFASRSVSRNRL